MKKKQADKSRGKKITPIPKSRNLEHSLELLGGAMKGKTIAFVVRNKDLGAEGVTLRYGVFMEVEASEKSKAIGYTDFLDQEAPEADVLVLRSERNVPFGRLKAALEQFKEKNPRSAVVAYAYGGTSELLLPLVDEGLIHFIQRDDTFRDTDLLRIAAKVLERRQG